MSYFLKIHLDTRDYTHPDRLVSKLLYYLKDFLISDKGAYF